MRYIVNGCICTALLYKELHNLPLFHPLTHAHTHITAGDRTANPVISGRSDQMINGLLHTKFAPNNNLASELNLVL